VTSPHIEDQALSAITDFATRALHDAEETSSVLLPAGWRQAAWDDLTSAGWTPSEIEGIGPTFVDPDGGIHEADIDITLSPLRRTTGGADA